MKNAPRITIKEIHDGEEDWSDFTPDNRRQSAREMTIVANGVTVAIAEQDKYDPSELYVRLELDETQLEGRVSVAQLDAAIALLTLARDTAIVEGMIAPAAPAGKRHVKA